MGPGEHIVASTIAFSDWFASVSGISLGLATAMLPGLGALWRFVQYMTHDSREVVRRTRLVAQLRSFIEVAVAANRDALVRLEEQRVLAHATAHVRAQPVDALKAVRGVGQRTLEELRGHGFHSIADVIDGDMLSVFRVGAVKADAVQAFIETAIQQSAADLALHGADASVPVDEGLEREYVAAREMILGRQTELGADVQELLTYDQQIAAFAEACQSRTSSERFRAFFADGLKTLADPRRPLRLLALAALFCGLLFLVPHAALAWDPGLLSAAGVSAAGLAWAGFTYLVVMYAVIADRTPFFRTSRLDPRDYRQQRLQFQAMQMSRNAGIAPPQLAIAPTPEINASAIGRPGGPAAIVLNAGLLDRMSGPSILAVLGHEVGHIAGDHQRHRRTTQLLAGPLRRLSHLAVTAAAGLWFKATRRVVAYGGVLYFPVDISSRTILLLPVFLLVLIVAFPVVALSLAFTAIGMAVSRQNEYDADRKSAEVIGSSDAMIDALDELSGLTDPGIAAPARQTSVLWMAYGIHPSEVHPILQWRAYLEAVHAWTGDTHPPNYRRIAALGGEASALRDLLAASVRSLIVVAVCGGVLWLSVAGAREVYDRLPAASPPTLSAVLSDANGAQEVAVLKRRCPLRARPRQASDKRIRRLTSGTRCAVRGPQRGMWHPVRCNGKDGWVSDWCVGEVLRPGAAAAD